MPAGLGSSRRLAVNVEPVTVPQSTTTPQNVRGDAASSEDEPDNCEDGDRGDEVDIDDGDLDDMESDDGDVRMGTCTATTDGADRAAASTQRAGAGAMAPSASAADHDAPAHPAINPARGADRHDAVVADDDSFASDGEGGVDGWSGDEDDIMPAEGRPTTKRECGHARTQSACPLTEPRPVRAGVAVSRDTNGCRPLMQSSSSEDFFGCARTCVLASLPLPHAACARAGAVTTTSRGALK